MVGRDHRPAHRLRLDDRAAKPFGVGRGRNHDIGEHIGGGNIPAILDDTELVEAAFPLGRALERERLVGKRCRAHPEGTRRPAELQVERARHLEAVVAVVAPVLDACGELGGEHAPAAQARARGIGVGKIEADEGRATAASKQIKKELAGLVPGAAIVRFWPPGPRPPGDPDLVLARQQGTRPVRRRPVDHDDEIEETGHGSTPTQGRASAPPSLPSLSRGEGKTLAHGKISPCPSKGKGGGETIHVERQRRSAPAQW